MEQGIDVKKDLLKQFGSINKMNEASIEELSKIVPENVAIEVKKYLHDYLENKTKQSFYML